MADTHLRVSGSLGNCGWMASHRMVSARDKGQLRGTEMSVTSHTKHGSSLGLLR